MTRNKYGILDAKTMKPIYSNLSRKTVHEKLGIGLDSIKLYACNHTCYLDKFFIVQQEEIQQDDFAEQWRAVTEKLKLYKGLEKIRITTEGEDNNA